MLFENKVKAATITSQDNDRHIVNLVIDHQGARFFIIYYFFFIISGSRSISHKCKKYNGGNLFLRSTREFVISEQTEMKITNLYVHVI